MITRRIIYRWILLTICFLVMEVIVARVLDDYILGPLEAWLLVGEEDNMETTGGTEGVGSAGDPYGREGGSA